MDNAPDAFAPLTESEIADALAQAPQADDADAPRPICPPADAENGALAAGRLFGGKPYAAWRYETAEGETAFYVCRWNEAAGKKVIRPVSYFDGEGWKFGAWPNDRPLYNLASINEKADAPIVVCEGEKAAESAGRIFTKSVATTASGGAGASNKSDWKALAGRTVLIWPDNDDAGNKYAHGTANALVALDCEVSIITRRRWRQSSRRAGRASLGRSGMRRTP